MNDLILKVNYNNENLWCVWSKEKIEIGEEYYLKVEKYQGELIFKTYKIDYLDYIEEDEN